MDGLRSQRLFGIGQGLSTSAPVPAARLSEPNRTIDRMAAVPSYPQPGLGAGQYATLWLGRVQGSDH